MLARLFSICWLMLLPLSVRAADSPQGITADGKTFVGSLAAADARWKLAFREGEKTRETPAAELVRWGQFVEPQPGPYLVPAGGGLIALEGPRIEGERVAGTSPLSGKVEFPLETIAAIVLSPPADHAAADRLLGRVQAGNRQSDRLLLDNGDELSGTVQGLDDTRVVLEVDGQKSEVKLDRLSAILFNPALVHRPKSDGLRAIVGLSEGSRVEINSVVADDKQARLKLTSGAELRVPTEAIAALQMLGGSVVYLSDLKPSSYKHIPYLELTWPYHNDRSVLGAALRAGGRLYLKGLGMHSPARITYDLDAPYRRFETLAAVDDEAEGRGSVIFRVFVDEGDGSWQPRAASEIVRGGQSPQPLTVDLSGAKRISLLVDFADRGDELDHADWLDARLVK